MADRKPDSSLADMEDIRQLKYRYFRALDTGDLDALRQCFLSQAKLTVVAAASKEVTGVDAIMNLISPYSTRAGFIAVHCGHHPEISFTNAANAKAIWYLHDKFIDLATKTSSIGTVLCTDTYVKTPDGWKIETMEHWRLYQEVDRWGVEKEIATPILEVAKRGRPK